MDWNAHADVGNPIQLQCCIVNFICSFDCDGRWLRITRLASPLDQQGLIG